MTSFARMLEQVTECEVEIASGRDQDGFNERRLNILKEAIAQHPDGAAGRALPPIIGRLG